MRFRCFMGNELDVFGGSGTACSRNPSRIARLKQDYSSAFELD